MHLVVAVCDALADAVSVDDTGIARRIGRTCISAQTRRCAALTLAAPSFAAIAITVTAVAVAVVTTVSITIAISATIAVAVSTAIAISLGFYGGSRDPQYHRSKQSRDYRSPGNSHAVRLFFAARLAHIL